MQKITRLSDLDESHRIPARTAISNLGMEHLADGDDLVHQMVHSVLCGMVDGVDVTEDLGEKYLIEEINNWIEWENKNQ